MVRSRKRLTILAALSALLLLLAACGEGEEETAAPAPDPTPDEEAPPAEEPEVEDPAADPMAELIAAAQEEGRLVFYSVPAEPIAQAVADEFTSLYGIEVEFVRLVSGDLIQRYSAEAEAGNVAADAILVSESPFLDNALEEGWLVPLHEAGLPNYPGDFPEEFITRDGAAPIVSINPTGIAYNTELVGDDPPTDWTDYADPRFEGQILMADPQTSDANVFFWDVVRREYGDDLLRDIAAQNPIWQPSAVPATQGVAAGEGIIAHPGVAPIVAGLQRDGAPVEIVIPDVTTGSEVVVAVSADAENYSAALLFASFLLSEEGSHILNVPFGAATPYGEGLPDGYQRPRPEALDDRDLIYELLGAPTN